MKQGIVASALGALTGGILASAMGHFWLLGVVLGGLIGYLTYGLPDVIAAAPAVWRQVRVWRPLTEGMGRLMFWSFTGTFMVALTTLAFAFGLIWAGSGVHGIPGPTLRGMATMTTIVAPTAAFTILVLFSTVAGFNERTRLAGVCRQMAVYGNPVSAVFWVVYGTASALWYLLGLIPDGLRFVPALLHTIYSDKRLIAGVSAFGGAAFGALTGMLATGALVAGVLYVLQHKLIYTRLVRGVA